MDDPELADQLTMLRLAYVEELEEVLKARLRTKEPRGNTRFGSRKCRQKVLVPPGRRRGINRRSVHAVRALPEELSSKGSSLDSPDNEEDLRQVYPEEAERYQNTRTIKERPTREFDQHRKQAEDRGTRNTSAKSNLRCAHSISGNMEI